MDIYAPGSLALKKKKKNRNVTAKYLGKLPIVKVQSFMLRPHQVLTAGSAQASATSDLALLLSLLHLLLSSTRRIFITVWIE